MGNLLAPLSLTASLNSAGTWEIDYQVTNTVAIVLTKMVIKGPVGSRMDFYIDNVLHDTTLRGDVNSNELLQPLIVWQGQMITLIWTLGNGTAPTATLFMQTYRNYR